MYYLFIHIYVYMDKCIYLSIFISISIIYLSNYASRSIKTNSFLSRAHLLGISLGWRLALATNMLGAAHVSPYETAMGAYEALVLKALGVAILTVHINILCVS